MVLNYSPAEIITANVSPGFTVKPMASDSSGVHRRHQLRVFACEPHTTPDLNDNDSRGFFTATAYIKHLF